MANASSFDSCTICLSEHKRTRPALCQCKHCSQSFCFDCMKDHNDQMQQDSAQLLNRYNEIKQLVTSKKNLITNETIKSKQQLNLWFRKFIDNLTAEKARIDMEIGKEENDVHKFVSDIEAVLQTLKTDIESFTEKNAFQLEHIQKLFAKLEELDEQLSSVRATREFDLPSTMPKYKLKFNYFAKSTTENIQQAAMVSEKQDGEKSNITEQHRSDVSLSDIETSASETSDISFPGEDYFRNRSKFEPTSYIVNCMASDGINLMYSTIEDSQQERIAYCYLDDKDSHYRLPDAHRDWNQPRIVDMIWWDNIDRFICATENGIYTVEYLDERFRIMSVINNRWGQLRIAGNTDHLCVHAIGKIMIYNTRFELDRLINFSIPRSLTRVSFCVTEKLFAFALIRRVKDNRDILQIEFYNFDMKREKRIRLGLSETSCILRTDGNDRFYVAMGQQRFHIVSADGSKQTINLGRQANCLAVLNSRNIVLTKSRSDVELVRC